MLNTLLKPICVNCVFILEKKKFQATRLEQGILMFDVYLFDRLARFLKIEIFLIVVEVDRVVGCVFIILRADRIF